MNESPFDRLLQLVLDPGRDEVDRAVAVQQLAELKTREAAEALLELASRPSESESLLKAAGVGLARLQSSGVAVSEWDVRDLAPAAAEAFLE